MPVKLINAVLKVKNEVVEADSFALIAIHIIKPVSVSHVELDTSDNEVVIPFDRADPPRIRAVWACLNGTLNTGETLEVNLTGQEALDFIVGDPILADTLMNKALKLSQDLGVLPIDAVNV